MEFLRYVFRFLTLLYVFNLVHFAWSNTCSNPPECKGASRFLMEVKKCTFNFNRECHCEKGYFCEIPIQYTCRRCKPCPEGTFINITSRNERCRQHTDCARLGMMIISKGNRTHDHVCAHISTHSTPSDLSISTDKPGRRTTREENSVLTPNDQFRIQSTIEKSIQQPEKGTITTERDTETAVQYHTKNINPNSGSTPPELSLSVSVKSGAPSPLYGPGSSQTLGPYPEAQVSHTWLPLMLLCCCVSVILLLGLAKWNKSLVLIGPQFEKNKALVQDSESLESVHMLSPVQSPVCPLVSDRGDSYSLDGKEPNTEGIQQITADHKCGRENVNNTVGSIFIYSPGMVVLGATNSPDRKGETEERQEEDGHSVEGQALTSTPQQESHEESVGLSSSERTPEGGPVQEAERKELCYPIPASGK
ncbi:hypothetical protein JZ751_008386 [Albula glossodonta]|uniref:TNFR-Cys domain-containing protein n=1 Tax=Albula glossodonta TaxID=121402 RepID=A0A8T2N168_9TELE|nr:hypothetical protein JZ751_008386 [Albula glossodonta]